MIVTTHILDAARGVPAAGVPVRLQVAGAADPPGAAHWLTLAATSTGPDGRADAGLIANPSPGPHRLVFDTGAYFAAQGVDDYFYPQVDVCFAVTDLAAHYHVPLLLSPFAYSTYRGN